MGGRLVLSAFVAPAELHTDFFVVVAYLFVFLPLQ